jgi:cell pole-organizing protein PopZ
MEEILASIRRIISEEGDPQPASPDVMDLTAPDESAKAEDDDLLVFEDIEDEPAPIAFETTAPAEPDWSTPAEPQREYSAPPASNADTLISDPAAAAAAGAFTRLAGSLRLADVQGQTLEGLVRELLRPMLREWLDAHLPKIVEAQVEAELNRISRMVR